MVVSAVESVQLLQQSLVIMMAGLCIVFFFLSMLIMFIKINQFLIGYFNLDAVQVKPGPAETQGTDQSLISAITIAVLEYEKDTI